MQMLWLSFHCSINSCKGLLRTPNLCSSVNQSSSNWYEMPNHRRFCACGDWYRTRSNVSRRSMRATHRRDQNGKMDTCVDAQDRMGTMLYHVAAPPRELYNIPSVDPEDGGEDFCDTHSVVCSLGPRGQDSNVARDLLYVLSVRVNYHNKCTQANVTPANHTRVHQHLSSNKLRCTYIHVFCNLIGSMKHHLYYDPESSHNTLQNSSLDPTWWLHECQRDENLLDLGTWQSSNIPHSFHATTNSHCAKISLKSIQAIWLCVVTHVNIQVNLLCLILHEHVTSTRDLISEPNCSRSVLKLYRFHCTEISANGTLGGLPHRHYLPGKHYTVQQRSGAHCAAYCLHTSATEPRYPEISYRHKSHTNIAWNCCSCLPLPYTSLSRVHHIVT